MNTIKIFLASSAELKEDREAFENFIGRENKILQQKGIFLHLDIWEDFIDAVSQTRLQDEYNKKIQEADIFVMLFFTKVGKYTEEEFDTAFTAFKKKGKPFIYTYFKQTKIKQKNILPANAATVKAFQQKLKDIGHFQTAYDTRDQLQAHFKQQLDKLFADGLLKTKDENQEKPTTTRNISMGDKSVYIEKGGDINLNIQ